MRVYLSSLGCKLNQAETERLGRQLVREGHELVATLDEADLHVVNSCTVTHLAARDSRKAARRGAREGRAIPTVLTGCYATASAAEAATLPGVALVVPNERKDRLLDEIREQFPEAGSWPSSPIPVSYVPLRFRNARSALKVEDGCNMRCSFCIIPSTRGRQRSRPVAGVVAEAQELEASGVCEIVVTGVQISSYRDGSARLYELMMALLECTGIERFRLSSIAPWQFDRRLLGLLGHERICRHVHLSLQSGCDQTLRRMRRPYSAAAFRDLVAEIRAASPGIAVTTDVIAGFPGEDEAEHEASVEFVREIGFARTHVFSYSERDGTHAATLPGTVPPGVRKRRTRELIEVGHESARVFAGAQHGQRAAVLWEERRGDVWAGTSDNYLRVTSLEEPGAIGQISEVVLDCRGARIVGVPRRATSRGC